MEKSFCLYCHTSPSGKRYIGVTKRKPEKRWNYGKGYSENDYFTKAIQKYGWDAFKHEILLTGLTEEEASRLEKEYINKFRSAERKYGYNIDLGGFGVGKIISEETKRKIGDKHRGKYTEAQIKATKTRRNPNYHHPDEIKKLIGDIHRGKPLSEEHKKKLSVAHMGMKPTNLEILRKSNMKPVCQYTLDGEFVKEYESIRVAATELGIHETSISANCRGKYRMAGGFIWKYKNG